LLSYLRGLHTPTYSSPQQRRGDDPDPRDDIHALGVIAYQMLTGKLDSGPGTGAARALKRMNMADNLAELLLSCTSEDLDERPENAGEFRKKLVELSPSQASGGRRLPVGSEATGSRRPPLARTEPAVVLPPPAPVRKARDRQQVTLSGGVSMAFAWCPPGTFLMGSPASEEGRCENELQHEVTLTKGFWIGVCPVTQEQWLSVMGSNPSYFPDFTRPVDTVSWQEAIEFCENLKDNMGLALQRGINANDFKAKVCIRNRLLGNPSTQPDQFGVVVQPQGIPVWSPQAVIVSDQRGRFAGEDNRA